METFSIRARANRSLSRNFWSIIAPERTFRSLVRKKVSPRAFWPCWNSSTTQSPPSHSMVMPFRKSLGFTMSGKGLYPYFPPPHAGGPVGPRERRFSARRAFETFGLGWGPAPCLDLGEDGVAQLLRSRHRAEHFGAIPPGGLQLDIPKAPGSAPQPLERGQVLDPIDGDRSGKLRNDAFVQDHALIGQHVLVRPPGPVIEVEDQQAGHEHAEHQEKAQFGLDRQQDGDHQGDRHRP